MDGQILDASAIDDLNDFDLTGDFDDLEDPNNGNLELPSEQNQEENQENQENQNLASEENLNLNPSQTSEEPSKTEDDFTMEILRLKGISDPTKIKFEDESGAIVERDWKDLSTNEKLNILSGEDNPERDLEEEEVLLINTLREAGLTPQLYIAAILNQAAQAALEKYQEKQFPRYEIDSLSDEELFALDLLEKVGEENITDEELQEALEQAKANETLFAKQIEGLRATYKNLEDLQKYDAEQAQIRQAEEQYQDFSNSVLNEIGSFNSFANLEIELSTDDKNDIANYLLTRRDSGISDFYSDMQDPATATLAAFWLLKGPEVLSEMEGLIKAAYQRGYSVGKAAKNVPTPNPTTNTTTLVVVQTPKPQNNTKNIDLQSAFGLEDDSYLQ